jgi:hypothetical protein
LSSHEVVGLVVIEHATETTGLAKKVFVDLDEDGFISVPFKSPSISGFLYNDVVGDSGNVKRIERVWKGKDLSRLGGDDWAFFGRGKGYPSIGDVNVDLSAAWSFWATFSVVFDFDGEGSRKDILDKGVVAGASESEHFSVKGSVVVLAPSHTVSSLFWGDLTLVHNAKDLSEFIFVNIVFFLDALWKVWVWVPLSIAARIVSSHWDGRDKLKSFVTSWKASKLTVGIFASDLAVNWSIKMLALLSSTDTRWKSLTASWEGWLVLTIFEVTEEEVGSLTSVAVFASKSAGLDTIEDLTFDGTVNWVESVTVIGVAWDKFADVASFSLSVDKSVFGWDKSAASIESELVSRSIFSNVNFTSLDLNVLDLAVFKFSYDLVATVSINSLDESGHFLLVDESDVYNLTFITALPVWGYWADSSPGIGGFSNTVDDVSVGVGRVVVGVGIVASANTGSGKAKSDSNEERVSVVDHSDAIEEIDYNNGVVLSVYFEGIAKFNCFGRFVGTVGLSLEYKSGRVAFSSVHKSTGLLLALMDEVIARSSKVVKTKLVKMKTTSTFKKGHLTSRTLVAKESSIKGLVPFTLSPDSASIVPVMMSWQSWALSGRASVADALWSFFVSSNSSSFDLNTISIDAPAVVFLIALKGFPGSSWSTRTRGHSTWGSSSASISLVRLLELLILGHRDAISLGHLIDLPLTVVAFDAIRVAHLLKHETGLAFQVALAVQIALEKGILGSVELTALGYSRSIRVKPRTLGGAARR